MLIESDDPPAVPLWINGHAYLTMAPEFCDVRDSAHDRVLRRTPLCAADVADNALESARKAGAEWRALPEADRRALCSQLAIELERYSEHFCHLIAEEARRSPADSSTEVAATLALLREIGEARLDSGAAFLAIVASAGMAMLEPLRLAVPGLAAGAVVVLKTVPSEPSALVALAELTGRCGFPPGVFNVVHGGEAMLQCFRDLPDVQFMFAQREDR